ncbi:DMT family transporter [Methanosphaerula palustris]|uniref:Small multidrug resistance protein n=1 Tax=Methanosphaerula palustris (strain ATCC BAA-1556 / DSM 19958 / E1-9c) TaxID=521011 RepID=B8GFT6_METPE|nr:multidrug efflux SMR transporter [Methanosphaerula palustris]ACL17969.1 small multidrug resistance protein [Methanosphaerula palustris E1-9c]
MGLPDDRGDLRGGLGGANQYPYGFTRPFPTLITLVTMGLSVYFLSLATRSLPLGTAYAVWTGTVIAGMILFNEPRGLARFLCILLILAGIAGLNLTVQQ